MHYQKTNIPITGMDYPDPDVIRVGDSFYMVTTTMYFMPGCEILKSRDLINWEHASYVYERLDSTPAQRLEGKENIYGQGMWAASIRYHDGTFSVCFVANDTHKTYLYTAKDINGPWEKHYIDGFYHDNSILFDDDGRVYIVYGNRTIYLTELAPDLSGPKEGGLKRIIVKDRDDAPLGYEGAHFYKINGRYYIFFISIPKEAGMRVESCFTAESLTDEFEGRVILSEDFGFHRMGAAQGGIFDTPDGKWYTMVFQDSGAVGRLPVILPVSWDGIWPVVDASSENRISIRQEAGLMKPFWQYNHEPDLKLVSFREGDGTDGDFFFRVTTDKLCDNVVQAKNTLTCRTLYPGCSAAVTVSGKELNDGDFAGLCLLEGEYAFIALHKEDGELKLCVCRRDLGDVDFWGNRHDTEAPSVLAEEKLGHDTVTITADCDFTDLKDEASFGIIEENGETEPFGPKVNLRYRLDHFTGVRFALFAYSTEKEGGSAQFTDFCFFAKE